MRKTDDLYISDIKTALERIAQFTKAVSFEEFEAQEMRYFAVIHMLEVLGEATNKLSKQFIDDHPDFPVRQIVGMRNFLVHDYDQISLEIVWKTIHEDILPLRRYFQ